jgi:hypothetical protein
MKPAVRTDAYEQGVKDERERIITLLEEQMIQGSYRDWLIALIKGTNNA